VRDLRLTVRRIHPRPTLRRRVPDAVAVGLLGVAALGVLYPILADRTQQPLAVFVVPTLIAAALGTWRQVAVVGGASLAVSTVEGVVQAELDAAGLAARLVIIVTCWLVGMAVAAERSRRQRTLDAAASQAVLIDAFQSSLVPAPLPPRRIAIEVRFQPGDGRLRLGGDFFDAIELPDGALGYIIGDVCGQGARAAALGAAVRTGWKTIATHVPDDPRTWVEVLESSFFRTRRREGFVTVNTGRLHPDHEHVRYVSAGHPWPIVVDPAGPRLERPIVSPPLGAVAAPVFHTSELTLPSGSTLLLHTDGLTENRVDGRRRLDGDAELLELLAREQRVDLDRLLAHFGPRGFTDDVAVMTISVPPPARGGSARLDA